VGGIIETALSLWMSLPAELQLTLTALFKIVVLLVPLILGVAYFTYWERKIIGWIQNRIGPNRVGWKACCSHSPI
jgi:NADH-quinone oxidoreductase subunit H